MNHFTDAIKIQASQMDSQFGKPRFGIVTSVDTANALAKVILQPDGVLSGWLPVLSPWVGQGWGFISLPSPGDQVLVVPQEGASEHGVIVGCCYSNVRRPPQAVAGELWLVHKAGSSIKLTNDGTVRIKGNLHVDGDVFDNAGSLSHLRATFNNHHHLDSRQGETSVPTKAE